MASINLITAPVGDIVTLGEFKNYLRVDHDDDNNFLQVILNSAVKQVENITRRKLLSQQWRLTLDYFHRCEIKLPFPNAISIDSIQYYNASNELVEFTDFESSLSGLYGYVKPNTSWPETYKRFDAVQIDFTCGYGNTANDIPESAKIAICVIGAQMYENRNTDVKLDFANAILSDLIIINM